MDNGLNYDDTEVQWRYYDPCVLECDSLREFYVVVDYIRQNTTKVTEQKFIELLKQK